LALVSDFLFRALLEAFLLLVTGRSALTERTVIARTRELSESNGALKHEISVRTRAEKELEGTCIMTKILIVEVDRKFVAALSVRLRAAGYEVVVAFDAAMAGSAAVKHRPDSLFWTFRCPAVTDSWWQRDYKTLCI
jgi:PleD family two-component response regulator